ncbi:MAG TPA: hypothetical protein VNQ90_05665 [Chthoniobacteraceae bacterium]|nr:hypothetical protein [Chthoniobacteraceae bacterium]
MIPASCLLMVAGIVEATPVYGVRIDHADVAGEELERTGAAVGLVSFSEKEGEVLGKDDFSTIPPFSGMRVCNVDIRGGTPQITYEGSPGFSRKRDTFVEIPLFYMRRTLNGSVEEREITSEPKEGFEPAPMFVERGKVLPKVYIGVYETSVVDGKAASVSGKDPEVERTLAGFRALYHQKGPGFSAMDVRTVMSLQHLYLIRFEDKNSQKRIGGGWTGFHQPYGKESIPLNAGVSDRLVANPSGYFRTHYFVGQRMGVVRKDIKGHPMVDRVTLLGIEANKPETGKVTLVFDKAVSLDPEKTLFGGAPQLTGWSDGLTHDTGRTRFQNGAPGLCSVRLFYIENLWGNVWHQLDGMVIRGAEGAVSSDSRRYNDSGAGYAPLGQPFLLQPDLGIPGDEFGFIASLGVDPVFPWFAAPDAVKGAAGGKSGYGDFYYQKENAYPCMMVHGGGFDHYDRAGLFCMRNWMGVGSSWYLNGSRMQYKPPGDLEQESKE